MWLLTWSPGLIMKGTNVPDQQLQLTIAKASSHGVDQQKPIAISYYEVYIPIEAKYASKICMY